MLPSSSWLAAIALSLCVLSGHAETLQGQVIAVSDGDTITVLDNERRQHTVRLQGIDAPEKAQPFGAKSKASLSDLSYRKAVSVEWAKRDRYKRIVGKVIVEGGDINLQQVKRGMAWWYEKYQTEQSPEDRVAYKVAEQDARTSKVGLWTQPNPQPPWEYRQARKSPR